MIDAHGHREYCKAQRVSEREVHFKVEAALGEWIMGCIEQAKPNGAGRLTGGNVSGELRSMSCPIPQRVRPTAADKSFWVLP